MQAMELTQEKQPAKEQLQDTAQLWNHALSFVRSMSLKCAIELGIPDVLHNHGKPITLCELATSLSIPPSKAPALGSLMRLLVHSGLFASHRDQEGEEEESYFLTPASKLLVKEEKACLSPFALIVLKWTMLGPAHQLGAWFRAGATRATPFDMAHGKGLFEETDARADFNELFNEGMASDARLVTEVALLRQQWEVLRGVRSVVDVGGGTGTLAKAIAKALPGVRCAVLDLPHVVATVDEEEREGVEFIGGDMFEHIPPADAVLFKWILHDWSDEDCIRILKRCKEAIPPKKDGGKVIIIDIVVGVTTDVSISVEPQLLFDIEMMILTRGKERSETEWRRLFLAAGFSDYKITASLGLRSVIELYN
ncbi:trans-resveratrol di-O-methyltransferase-like [Phoenix dactylifera]|uniref:Trans-resveratrol di-O-methyltransferase-like n=1 Tax=Phoenix dactylifera TaxID=42345 RepID=A0A8B9AGN9_PHODC|nr:trans-resveratrol di-O-methyltransferase-like [Phoenix dactylifera]